MKVFSVIAEGKLSDYEFGNGLTFDNKGIVKTHDKCYKEEIKHRYKELIEELKQKCHHNGIDIDEENLNIKKDNICFIDLIDIEAMLIRIDANIEEYKNNDLNVKTGCLYVYPHYRNGCTLRRFKWEE